ncbi:unnamed protein product, partial [Musa acuminata var. zebrina]
KPLLILRKREPFSFVLAFCCLFDKDWQRREEIDHYVVPEPVLLPVLHAAAGDPPRRARLRLRRLLPRFPQDQRRLARRHATGRRLPRWAALLPRRRPSCFLKNGFFLFLRSLRVLIF